MPLFLPLLIKMIPLYMNISLGYVAGRWLNASRDTIARIMFFIINPLIIFNAVVHTKLDASILSLPFLVFIICCSLCLLFYKIGKMIWNDSSRNLLALSAGCGNTGYFGIPIALLLFDEQETGIYIMAILGMTFFENTLGYYMCAKETKGAAGECLRKICTLPAIYAFFAGLLCNACVVEMPVPFFDFMGHIKGTYTVLGMMIIGLGLAGLSSFKLDLKFIGISFFAKFIIWPLIILGVITLDLLFFEIYSPHIHQALILLSIVPIGVNTVIIASLLNAQPEKAASAALMSTLFAIAYVPFMVTFLIS